MDSAGIVLSENVGKLPILFVAIEQFCNFTILLVELDDEDIASYPDLKDFCKSIRVNNKMVYALAEPDTDYLLRKEREYLDKWYNYCKEKDSFDELSPESHNEAYNKAYARYLDDPS